MNVHQIITGALNHGESVFAVGSVEGINFTACAVGCDIVILASDFQRVQIIPGCSTGYVQVACVDCCYETGKIAAAFFDLIRIYEPMALSHHTSKHKLDYQWFETCCFNVGGCVMNLSWNLEGMRLLVSTEKELQMFQHRMLLTDFYGGVEDEKTDSGIQVKFHVTDDEQNSSASTPNLVWESVWSNKLAFPIRYIKFSPDGSLFATSGPSDHLVKIWYQDCGGGLDPKEITFSFTYLPHPKSVVGFEWRKTGRYTPRGSVMNVLITWCRDHICRIWCETAMPAEACGEMFLELKVDNYPVRNASQKGHRKHHSPLKNAGHKVAHRLKQLKKMKKVKDRKSDLKSETSPKSVASLSQVPSASYFLESADLPPVVHFHLATSIHAENDCFLVPSLESGLSDTTFAIHWMNNKELVYSLAVENLLAEALAFEHQAIPITPTTGMNGFLSPSPNDIDGPTTKQTTGVDGESNSSSEGTTLSSKQITSQASEYSVAHRDILDYKLEVLLRDWQQSSDILFTIHPLDGSLLVWTVDFLDNSSRQPQVVFSSRLPGVFPLSDAASLNHNVATFNPHDPIYVDLLHRSGEKTFAVHNCPRDDSFPCHMCNTIFLLTNHQNGTLNLWHLNVDEKSKFCQIMSVTHKSRMCGHRFRINAISCHPVLPLFLTTSHHNIRRKKFNRKPQFDQNVRPTGGQETLIFNSEMILWKVNPVGPLCKSGGVRELARINSPELTAFSSIAWIPAILPSSTLGSVSNSPSSCFVASDGKCLRVFQAVIDARALLAEVNYAKSHKNKGAVSPGSDDMSPIEKNLSETFNIVSSQSTARPGCIIELDILDESVRDWKNVLLLHVYHEQMILSDRPTSKSGSSRPSNFQTDEGVVVDRSKATSFNDSFYLVALEKIKNETSGSFSAVVHIWLLVMASQPPSPMKVFSPRKASSYQNPAEFLPTADDCPPSTARLFLYSKKVCTQQLHLPVGVKIIQACPAAGHLPSASLYPACLAPYLLVTTCSDDKMRYWYCKTSKDEFSDEIKYSWQEWKLMNDTGDSSLELDGQILSVSCAYSGRFACSFDPSNSFDTSKSDKVNVEVAVYECESTGGTEWMQEDILHLRDIRIPRVVHQLENYEFHKESPVDELLHTGGGALSSKIPSISNISSGLRSVVSEQNFLKQDSIDVTPRQMVRLDWVSTEDGAYILTIGVGPKIFLFAPVAEDVAQKNVAMMHESETHHHQKRPMLRKASTIVAPAVKKLIRWVNMRTIDLDSADGLPPLPLMLSWVREGILIVGMETEMRVYNQWNISTSNQVAVVVGNSVSFRQQSTVSDQTTTSDGTSSSTTVERPKHLHPNLLSTPKLTISPSHSALDLTKKAKEHTHVERKKPATSKSPKSSGGSHVQAPPQNDSTEMFLNLVRDEGLFEAARLATPLLPQYHPRQLMELLNAGKTRRVKAILLHVLRCIRDKSNMWNDLVNPATRKQSSTMSIGGGSDDESGGRSRSLGRRPDMSSLSEDSLKDYIDIDSIPPLPLHALIAAESGDITAGSFGNSPNNENVEDLFNGVVDDEELDIDITDDDGSAENKFRGRKTSTVSMDNVANNAFSAKHTRLLSKALTHIHLPGLSSVDQMHLLAVSDTLSSFSADVIDKLAQANAGYVRTNLGDAIASGQAGYSNAGTGIDTVDECGLRFLMAVKQHEYLLLCLPLKQRAHLRAKGLASSYIIWALHSDSENELLNSLSCFQKGAPKWEEFRTVGAGWWLKNLATLKICMEKVAKAAFQLNSDPMDAAIYYLAMKKKNLLAHLYKSARDTKMMDFFANDFTTEKWKKAALKNAFVLLGKQRFEHAVAFFLLGEALHDALQVCVSNLNDLQLALVIVRLYETNLEQQQALTKDLLCKHVLGIRESQNFDDVDDKSTSDPFLRSMAYWLLKEYSRALSTLIEDRTMFIDSPYVDSTTNVSEVFNFYVYLRKHPLVVRQRLVDSGVQIGSTEKFLQLAKSMESQITSIERKLYFKTASTHFKSGCPLLALEVLCKLPKKICLVPTPSSAPGSKLSTPLHTPAIVVSGQFDLDSSKLSARSEDMDWSSSLATDKRLKNDGELELKWSDDEAEEEEEDKKKVKVLLDLSKPTTIGGVEDRPTSGELKTDIMAQQLKFIACLKIIMEELSTLASGYEVDGGHLRAQLYYWLEKEVEVLRQLCDYNVNLDETLLSQNADENSDLMCIDEEGSGSQSLFHEALKNDRANMTARWQQSSRRRHWLTANQQLLRTLLAYCSLHSSQGVGLASARMELLLLLQELHQEPVQRSQLAAPIPLQSNFPLLAASVASIKTDIAGPLRYLHCQISDLLKSFCDIQYPPTIGESQAKMSMFYSLSQCLSSCIYESLCDIENLPVPKGASGHGYLLRRKRRKTSSASDDLNVSSAPHKWPGAENLLAYLSRERDEDVPNLLLLLAESWVAVYLALFTYAISSYDSRWLYRLVAHPVNAALFSCVFGGGAEKKQAHGVGPDDSISSANVEIIDRTPPRPPPPGSGSRDMSPFSIDRLPTVVDPANLRAKFNARIFGPSSAKSALPLAPNRKPSLIITTKNHWVPPRKSILSTLSMKPLNDMVDVYDSDAGSVNEETNNDEDDDVDENGERVREKNTVHLEPNSYAWTLLRFSLVRQAYYRVQQFLSVCGFEIGELGTISPLVHGCLRNLDDWKRQLASDLEAFEGGCPTNFLPNMCVERSSSAVGPPLHKYRTILESDNTPFSMEDSTAGAVRRLWLYLVKQEHLMDIFIRYIFKSKPIQSEAVNDTTAGATPTNAPEFLKIAHREQEPITAFAVSQSHFGWIVVSTGRELQEMDIVSSLAPSRNWLQDPTEIDLAMNELRRDPLRDNDDYILINPTERRDTSSGRTSFLCKRNVGGVRRMEAHPNLPYYLSGSNDGSVRLWEWGVGQPLFVPRTAGQFAKVTRTRFNIQGNKFGITDNDGSMCLWQISHGMTMKKPYLNMKCHKTAADFTFMGNSSSLLATAGYSSGDVNVALWDTLLPPHKSLIHSWPCHPEGATGLLYVPQQQVLMSSGRHGEVCVFDVRQRLLRSTLKVFDHSAVKSMALHPAQDYFVVGSADGDIKVYNTSLIPQLLYTFPNEHSTKGGFSLRQANFSGQIQGVQNLYVDNDHRLFSCGADCSFKIRVLPSLLHEPHVI